MDGIPTGINFFDRVTDGFFRGKPYLVFGASGTGKSIFGLQFAQAGLGAGESVLYICREKAEDLVQQGERLGFPLAEALDDERLILLEYDNDFREIVTRQGPTVVLDELRTQVDEKAIRRVILDPVDPFFASLDDEALLRAQLRALTERFESLGWTPLVLCDDATVNTQPFVLRVFSEVCWGLFELRRDADGESETHTLRVYKMRNVQLERSRFEFRIADGGIKTGELRDDAPVRRPSFSRFRRPAAARASDEPTASQTDSGPPGAPPGDAPGPAGAAEARPQATAPTPPAKGIETPAHAEPPAAPRPPADGFRRPEPAVATPAPSPTQAPAPRRAGASALRRAADEPGRAAHAADELLDDAEMERIERAATSRPERHAPPRVLVADPDAEMRSRLCSWIGECAQPIEARHGLQALELAQRMKPDAIIAEARMPRLNGIGLCRVLRESGVEVPILFLASSAARAGELLLCGLVGGNDVVEKPVDPPQLLAKLGRLLDDREAAGPAVWPAFDATGAIHALGPHQLEPMPFRSYVERACSGARQARVPLCLVGYEFRFFDKEEGHTFVERFAEVLTGAIRTEDAVARVAARRLAVLLLDADADGARAVVRRVHERMSAEASGFAGALKVKPKALYRLLALHPEPLDGEDVGGDTVERLFQQPARIIEEDTDARPGEPIEKYPLLEAVFAALHDGAHVMVSPLDGTRHEIATLRPDVRAVEIGDYLYRTQDPREDSPAGYRAARGTRIVFVARANEPERAVARIEDGRTFRGREV